MTLLGRLAVQDIELARQTVAMPWFTDGITRVEVSTIEGFNNLAHTDVELAQRIAELSWFTDSITTEESSTIRRI